MQFLLFGTLPIDWCRGVGCAKVALPPRLCTVADIGGAVGREISTECGMECKLEVLFLGLVKLLGGM